MSVYLRPAASLADFRRIEDLSRAVWREHYTRFVSPAQVEYMLARGYGAETLHHEMRHRGVHYECAFEGEDLVAYAAYGPVSPLLVKLHKINVRSDRQRRGIGQALLAQAIAFARERAARRIALAVNRGNDPAIAAYRRWGFDVTRTERVAIGEGFAMDDFVMELVLHPPRPSGTAALDDPAVRRA